MNLVKEINCNIYFYLGNSQRVFGLSKDLAADHLLPHAREGISYNIFDIFEDYDYISIWDCHILPERIKDELIL